MLLPSACRHPVNFPSCCHFQVSRKNAHAHMCSALCKCVCTYNRRAGPRVGVAPIIKRRGYPTPPIGQLHCVSKMEFRQLLFSVGLALSLTTLIVNSSPVIHLEKNGGRTQTDVNVGTPWESCSMYLYGFIFTYLDCHWLCYYSELQTMCNLLSCL